MPYEIAEILEVTAGELLNATIHPAVIVHLSYDTRKIIAPSDSLFFALQGQRFDGHWFIKEAYQKGIRNFVIDQATEIAEYPKANFILVKDSLAALQAIAMDHCMESDIPTIGITGSNGKTVVKEWLFQLLKDHFNIVKSPKSYNSQLGVPLSVWETSEENDLGIFEAGISKPGEMEKLEQIIMPTMGILTNIGSAHDEGFKSRQQKLEEKLKLFAEISTWICRIDDPLIMKTLRKRDEFANPYFFPWSTDSNSPIGIGFDVQKQGNRTFIQSELGTFIIPFTDEASIENAIHCFVACDVLGVDLKQIAQRMLLLEPVEMRLERKAGINGCTIINDAYNSDLTSLKIALDFLAQQQSSQKKVVILSDIHESKAKPKDLYKKVSELLIQHEIDELIAIGPQIQLLLEAHQLEMSHSYFESTEAYLAQIDTGTFTNKIILLKGARVFKFEKIANLLSQKAHKTTLEINLSALLHNLNHFHSYLNADTKMLTMVKASAYGSGSLEVAQMLAFQKVDYLGVAYIDEGVELRKNDIELPILVLNPEESGIHSIVQYNLEPEVYELDFLKKLIAQIDINIVINIHVKLETGMNRLGFERNELDVLAKLLTSVQNIKVASIFSHLVGSSSAEHDDFSRQQVAVFTANADYLSSQLGYTPFRHILNSGGISRFPEYQMDMVRLGIGLYGIDSTPQTQAQLQVVNTLKATISQIKEVAINETIGYNRKGIAQKASRIATISIGYADGLLRLAGNGNYSLSIHGQLAPIVGNVCMDMCMVDVTDIPTASVGDEVIVFGDKPSVSDLAKALHTIPYEVFTNISKRVKRVYFQE